MRGPWLLAVLAACGSPPPAAAPAAFDPCRITVDVQVVGADAAPIEGATIVPISERNGGPSIPPNHETGPEAATGADGRAKVCDIAESGNLPGNYEQCSKFMSYDCSHRRGSVEVHYRDWPQRTVTIEYPTTTVTLVPATPHP